jgi:hypothetical protein
MKFCSIFNFILGIPDSNSATKIGILFLKQFDYHFAGFTGKVLQNRLNFILLDEQLILQEISFPSLKSTKFHENNLAKGNFYAIFSFHFANGNLSNLPERHLGNFLKEVLMATLPKKSVPTSGI